MTNKICILSYTAVIHFNIFYLLLLGGTLILFEKQKIEKTDVCTGNNRVKTTTNEEDFTSSTSSQNEDSTIDEYDSTSKMIVVSTIKEVDPPTSTQNTGCNLVGNNSGGACPNTPKNKKK